MGPDRAAALPHRGRSDGDRCALARRGAGGEQRCGDAAGGDDGTELEDVPATMHPLRGPSMPGCLGAIEAVLGRSCASLVPTSGLDVGAAMERVWFGRSDPARES